MRFVYPAEIAADRFFTEISSLGPVCLIISRKGRIRGLNRSLRLFWNLSPRQYLHFLRQNVAFTDCSNALSTAERDTRLYGVKILINLTGDLCMSRRICIF
jgi:hypothetical protein